MADGGAELRSVRGWGWELGRDVADGEFVEGVPARHTGKTGILKI